MSLKKTLANTICFRNAVCFTFSPSSSFLTPVQWQKHSLTASPVPVISSLWDCNCNNNRWTGKCNQPHGCLNPVYLPTAEMPSFSRNPVQCSISHSKRTVSGEADGPSPCCWGPSFLVDCPPRCLFCSFLKTLRERSLQTNKSTRQLCENWCEDVIINPFNPSRAARNLAPGCGRGKCYIETEETSVKVATRNIEVNLKAICISLEHFPFKR